MTDQLPPTQIEGPGEGDGRGATEVIRRDGSPAGNRSIGRYRDLAFVARGGMGTILEAEDPELGRKVALKILDDPSHEVARRYFENEARVTAGLEHPNIVPVHEMGFTSDGRPYFAMKLVRGRSLREALPGAGRMRLLGDFVKICDAVSFAHSRGILHRDLKPDNVMIGEFGEVQVMDWGLAKVRGSPDSGERPGAARGGALHRTMDGTLLGTPAYMSPEQARGEVRALDERSDV